MNDTLKKLIRQHFLTMDGYVSAGMEMTKDDNKIFMNANENPFQLPGLEGLNRYPEPQPAALLEAFGREYGIDSDSIVITRGADEAIAILIRLFCEPNKDSIIINPPTFGIYSVDAHTVPTQVIEVPLLKENTNYSLDIDGIIREVKNAENNVKIVFLCSPNNPTGTSFPHEQIWDLCDALEEHAVVVLDETYAEFSKNGSLVKDLEEIPNLIILRTLSKSFAFAGMRIGCFLSADTEFIKLVRSKALETYPLTRLSIEAAYYVLSPETNALAKENIQKILVERDKLCSEIKKSSHVMNVYPSDANFLLVEMNNAKSFYEFALNNNIVLRDFSSKKGTENCLRISIGKPEENELLLRLFKEFRP